MRPARGPRVGRRFASLASGDIGRSGRRIRSFRPLTDWPRPLPRLRGLPVHPQGAAS